MKLFIVLVLILTGLVLGSLVRFVYWKGYEAGWRANEETLVNGWVRFYGNEASQLDYWKLRAKNEGLTEEG